MVDENGELVRPDLCKRNSERTFPCHAGWLTMATPSMAKERSDGSSFLASSR
jgi:hypothetical protein